jgi:flagellar motor switch protein FliN/FliY
MDETTEQTNESRPSAGTDQKHCAGNDKCDLDLILDIPLEITVELGKVKMPINELLQLGQGSIIELTKAASEPLDIYINKKLIAKGEVVILDERFGIRVADIINPDERVKSLS